MAPSLPAELQNFVGALGELADVLKQNVSIDGSTPLALLEHQVNAQLVQRAHQQAEPVYHMIAAALGQISNPADQAKLTQHMLELTRAVADGRPDQIAGVQAAVFAVINAADNDMKATSTREGRDAHIARIWGDMQRLDEDLDKDLEYMHEHHLISEEEYARLKAERQEAYRFQPGTPEWQQANDRYSRDYQQVAKDAEQRARDTTPEGSPERERTTDATRRADRRAQYAADARQTAEYDWGTPPREQTPDASNQNHNFEGQEADQPDHGFTPSSQEGSNRDRNGPSVPGHG